MDTTALIIIGLSSLAGILIGGYLAQWLLQLYYHINLLNQAKYLRLYDRFSTQEAFKFLSKIQKILPKDYEAYLAFHKRSRSWAYLYYSRFLLLLAIRSLVVLLFFVTIPILITPSHQWAYLAFMIVLAGQIIYKVLIKKQGRKFNRLAVMSIVLVKLRSQED